MTRQQILESALLLTVEERLQLATEVLETVSVGEAPSRPEGEELLMEVRRRAGDGQARIPWETVRDQVRGSRTS